MTTTKHPLNLLYNVDRPALERPWHITWNGDPYTVAGDGFRILAMKGHLPQGAKPDAKKGAVLHANIHERWKKALGNCFDQDREYPVNLSLEAIMAFQPRMWERGDDPAFMVATFQGVPFNFSWVREVLSLLEAEQVTVSRSDKMLRVETDQWCYYQMGMLFSEESIAAMPKLEDVVG